MERCELEVVFFLGCSVRVCTHSVFLLAFAKLVLCVEAVRCLLLVVCCVMIGTSGVMAYFEILIHNL